MGMDNVSVYHYGILKCGKTVEKTMNKYLYNELFFLFIVQIRKNIDENEFKIFNKGFESILFFNCAIIA